MLLGVVSDTHGHVPYAREAVRMLESLEVEAVIHCGDIGSPEIVPLFSAWPSHFVFGNVDDPEELTASIRACGQQCHGRFGSLELAEVPIAFLHGDDERRLQDTIRSGQWRLVCHGHTHVPRQVSVGKTIVLNPGALYRANPHTLAVVDLPSLAITSIRLNP